MFLSAHQPAYLPWLGYFEKIVQSDVFVFLDTVQFEKNSFINRNKVKTPQGPQWLTIPVKTRGHIKTTLRETMTDEAQPWRIKHLKTIESRYRRATYFKECFPKLEALLLTPGSSLAELCWRQLQFWLAEFEIETPIYRSSGSPVASKKSDLILDLCKHFGATCYLSGALGRNYLNEDSFAAAGIEVEYQNFSHPTYPQLWGSFEPNMGIVDAWMNCGSNTRNLLNRKRDGI
ncbi:MAG: WbqC family protein [Burkholderiales bacterium]